MGDARNARVRADIAHYTRRRMAMRRGVRAAGDRREATAAQHGGYMAMALSLPTSRSREISRIWRRYRRSSGRAVPVHPLFVRGRPYWARGLPYVIWEFGRSIPRFLKTRRRFRRRAGEARGHAPRRSGIRRYRRYAAYIASVREQVRAAHTQHRGCAI